jgi:uncharacterized membrane protein
MYKIIGADQKEYGPVSGEQVKRWIAEGRANAQTLVRPEGAGDWMPLASLPEFADLLGPQPGAAAAPAILAAGLPQDLFERDYNLDIGECVSRSWDLVKSNFGILFGGVAVFMLIQGAVSLLGAIPVVGILVTLGSVFIMGPITGGLYLLYLKVLRGQPAEIGDLFAGFKTQMGQLVLAYLVVLLLTAASALPGAAIMAYPFYSMIHHHAFDPVMGLLAALGLIVAFVPAIYLSVSWLFTLPLVIDRQMEFWPAMGASRRMVGKHWWLVLGLVVVCGLINLAGMLACCVGVFVSLPVVLGAMMYGYEIIFSGPAPQGR